MTAGGRAETRLSVVAFVDILGFRQETERAYTKGNAGRLLIRLRSALNKSYRHLEAPATFGPRRFELKAFTDNIVIGYPIKRDGEFEMGRVFGQLARFQLEMIRSGFFVRGGISIGELFVDEQLVFGNGLLQAYDAESRLARDPRIVLTKSAEEYVMQHLGRYEAVEFAPQYRDLLRDADGQLFLNYLDNIAEVQDEAGLDFEAMRDHKRAIETNLREFEGDPHVWSKYAWAGNYHNIFCGRYGEDLQRFRIRSEKLRQRPRLLDGTVFMRSKR